MSRGMYRDNLQNRQLRNTFTGASLHGVNTNRWFRHVKIFASRWQYRKKEKKEEFAEYALSLSGYRWQIVNSIYPRFHIPFRSTHHWQTKDWLQREQLFVRTVLCDVRIPPYLYCDERSSYCWGSFLHYWNAIGLFLSTARCWRKVQQCHPFGSLKDPALRVKEVEPCDICAGQQHTICFCQGRTSSVSLNSMLNVYLNNLTDIWREALSRHEILESHFVA